MHSAQHAGNELVDTVTLLYETYQRGYPALIIASTLKVGEDEFLEGIDLVLQGHEVGNGFITRKISQEPDRERIKDLPLVRIVDGLQTNVFLVFE
jgi:hypothetical protein